MGETTFVSNKSESGIQPARTKGRMFQVDLPLVICTLILAILGIVMVYSASWRYSLDEFGTTSAVVNRQIQVLIVGLVAGVFVTFFDYHHYRYFLVVMVVITIIALGSVLIFGQYRFGAKRALFGSSVQPSEIAKLVVILYLSFWLKNRKESLNDKKMALIPLSVILAVFGGLTVLQPDLSAAITIVLLGVVMFYLAEANSKQILLMLAIYFAVGMVFILISDNGRGRLITYWAGLRDPANASSHVRQSLEAIVEGGFFGVGIGKGSIKVVNLPVAWTDSIFAVIAEELGLLGCIAVICLYMVILWRGLHIAHNAPDTLGKLMAGGITFWIIWEAVLNMGVLVNLFPFAGNALPLISSGGSSLVTVLTGIGILTNISRKGTQATSQDQKEGSIFSAFTNLRRWDRRRRVPSSDRFTSRQR